MSLRDRFESSRRKGRLSVPLPRVTLLSAIAFGALAALFPQAAGAAVLGFAFVVAACLVPQRERAEARLAGQAGPSQPAPWPDQGMKAVVEALQEPAFVIDRNLLLRYRNAVSQIAFGNMALADPISLRFRAPEFLSVLEASVDRMEPATTSFDERQPLDRTWRVQIVPVPASQDDAPAFFLVVFHDRTAERRIERMRTDFVANASHELRTPLASLAGFIETLQGPARNDAAARERFLAIMREQAGRMSRLIDDLLSLSRIEMRRHVAVTGSADLKAILSAVREQLLPLAGELGVEIAFDPPERDFVVAGEPDELTQVFSNLVENACKYGESGRRVVLRLEEIEERGQRFVDAAVEDFGPGIAAHHVPRLTERFYRAEAGSSPGKRGTGLGLAIVRNILLRHRARLVIDSELGRGSIFTARFPLPEGDLRKS